jgi:D-amino-acid dehydrogenase
MKRVAIVGGGVIGLCTAYYCALRGHEVHLLDRNPEMTDGCSYGNAGMIVPSHFVPLAAPGMVALGLKWMWNPESPFYIKPRLNWDLMRWGIQFCLASTKHRVDQAAPILRDLSLASRLCYEELQQTLPGGFGLVQRGLLMLCRTQHALDDESKYAEHASRLGVPAEVLDRQATNLKDPSVKLDVAGSVYFPKDCHLSPNQFMFGIKQACQHLGVRCYWNTEVSQLVRTQDRIHSIKTVRDNAIKDEIEIDEIVICGGSWSPVLAKQLGLSLPMQAGKGYSLTLNEPRELPELCSILTEARIAVTPMGQSLRFGGTMEIAGMDESISLRRVQGIIRAIPNYFPSFRETDFEGIQPWYGLRPCSPDGMPYLGRTKRYRNLTIATGHAMMGLSLGPITGKIVASVLENEPSPISLSLLSPDRCS